MTQFHIFAGLLTDKGGLYYGKKRERENEEIF